MKHILRILLGLLATVPALTVNAQVPDTVVVLDTVQFTVPLRGAVTVLNDEEGTLTLDQVLKKDKEGAFISPENPDFNSSAQVHWVKFTVDHRGKFIEYKLGVAYTDIVRLYSPLPEFGYSFDESGDLLGLSERPVKNGQMVFLQCLPMKRVKSTYYVRLESTTYISQQLRGQAVGSLTMYSDVGFKQRFVTPKIYQAVFYGALFIMIFYNFFIFITLRSRDYLYYVGYLFGIALFFSSNGGYLMELVLPENPRLDLYVRFLSTPLLMVFYLQFSQSYLRTDKTSNFVQKTFLVLKILFGLSIVMMIAAGQWKFGRLVTIIAAMFSYLLILAFAIRSARQGYSPARYFIAANIVLILGALLFAFPRLSGTVQNPITQYGVQLGIIIEVSLFSIGLADRINLARKELEQQKLAQVELEKQQEIEKQQLIEEKNRELEQKVVERTAEVVAQKEELAEKNKDITDSINYASRIQRAILPNPNFLANSFNDHFVLFKPKDIVSGDFYWAEEIDGNVLFAAVDCTGHGVPGAMVSVVGRNGLNRVVKEWQISQPGQVLDKLTDIVMQTFEQSESEVKDGMDMALCSLNRETRELQYAGANNPLWVISQRTSIEVDGVSIEPNQSSEDGKVNLFEVKATKQPVGSFDDRQAFENHSTVLDEGDMVCVFSDGYPDQFGGPNGKKYKYRPFKKLIISHFDKPMQQLGDDLDTEITEWMGEEYIQIDDICVFGVRV